MIYYYQHEGLPKCPTEMIKCLYSSNTIHLENDGSLTEPITINQGSTEVYYIIHSFSSHGHGKF